MSREMIKPPSSLITAGESKRQVHVFLAGPIQGAIDWQDSVPAIEGVVWINPRRDESSYNGVALDDTTHFEQVDWETKGLRSADIVLFWIPPQDKEVPGRHYAQTTKIELMENLARGKKVVLGMADGTFGGRYLKHKAIEYGVSTVHNNLEDCIKEVREIISTYTPGQLFFTSDTHFGAARTLALSRRPFRNLEDMDWTMIERWNTKVPPTADVYHLGDFGDRSIIPWLNGNIHLICGNYEQEERLQLGLDIPDYITKLMEDGFSSVKLTNDTIDLTGEDGEEDYVLSLHHKPLSEDTTEGWDYKLFGHIHGRQQIKRRGIDVGVDCNQYSPMSEKDVRFFLNALDKGYYDEDVWSK